MYTGTQTKQFVALKNAYRQAGQPWPVSSQAIARWAIATGKYDPPPSDAVDRLARQIAGAMAHEYIVDPQGRPVRMNHAAKVKGDDRQMQWEWDDIRTASRAHMEASIKNRRMQVVGDCTQAKLDTDSYNQNYNPGDPIPFPLDFTEDVAENEALARLIPHTPSDDDAETDEELFQD